MLQMIAGILAVWLVGDQAGRLSLQYWPEAQKFGFYAAQFLVFCVATGVVGIVERAGNPGGSSPGGWDGFCITAQRFIAGTCIALLFGDVLGRLLAIVAADLVPQWTVSWQWPARVIAFLLGTSLGWIVPTILTLGMGDPRRKA